MKKYNGFTLIELMIVMAIVGLFTLFAAPGMRAYISNSASHSASNTFLLDIMYARNHAITNSVIVTMSPTHAVTGSASLGDPDSDGVNWALGWQVLAANSPSPLRQQASFGVGTEIRAPIAGSVLDIATPISFSAIGASINQGTFDIGTDGCAGFNARRIQINQIGQVFGNDIECPAALSGL